MHVNFSWDFWNALSTSLLSFFNCSHMFFVLVCVGFFFGKFAAVLGLLFIRINFINWSENLSVEIRA